MGEGKNIAIFIDYDNIFISLEKNYTSVPAPGEIGKAIRGNIEEEFGRVLIANAYSDWTRHKKVIQAQAELDRTGITCVQVASTWGGKDRSDPKIIIDAMKTLAERNDMDMYFFVAGDGDYKDLIRELKSQGKEVGVCAVTATLNRDLVSEANVFVPLENWLNITTISEWSDLIEKLAGFEKWASGKKDKWDRPAFVGVKYFINTVPGRELACEDTFESKRDLITRAIEQGIIEKYQVPPPPGSPEGTLPTSAMRLNHQNPVVEESLRIVDRGA